MWPARPPVVGPWCGSQHQHHSCSIVALTRSNIEPTTPHHHVLPAASAPVLRPSAVQFCGFAHDCRMNRLDLATVGRSFHHLGIGTASLAAAHQHHGHGMGSRESRSSGGAAGATLEQIQATTNAARATASREPNPLHAEIKVRGANWRKTTLASKLDPGPTRRLAEP